MTTAPLISVLIPCYNHERYVQQTLRSVLQQTYGNLELILFNDGSTDATHEKIMALEGECRRRFVRFEYQNKTNEGLSRTLNRGLALARGEFVFHLASDDHVEPQTIERLLSAVAGSPQVALACGDADFVNDAGQRIYLEGSGEAHLEYAPDRARTFLERYAGKRTDFDYRREFGEYSSLLLANYIPIGLLVRRRAQLEAGPYDTSYHSEDHEMWLKVSKTYKMVFLDEVLAHYRWHGGNMSKVRRAVMVSDAVRLLMREKPYCVQNGLSANWEAAYRHAFLRYFVSFLREGDLRMATRLAAAGGPALFMRGVGSVLKTALVQHG